MSECGLLTNHAHVLVCVAREPNLRLREIATTVGVTERAAHRIVCELESAGYLRRERVGRCNVYAVEPSRRLSHPVERGLAVGDLLAPLLD